MKPFAILACLAFATSISAQTPSNDAAFLLDHLPSGGLIVHVGAGDGSLAAELAEARPSSLIHALDADPAQVAKARERFRSSPAGNRLSADLWSAETLPHAENLVNLLILEEGSPVTEAEATRVLAPGGTVCRREHGTWTAAEKPHAPKTVEWTHYQYDAANNPVGEDPGCGLPRRFQWAGTPLWSAAHESMASLNAMVSANGRLFYIIDEGPRASIQLPSDWQLVARDAYNGVVLWRKPLEQWLTRFWPWKSGPAQMPRKLIAIGDHVYAPLDINGALVDFDAATGEALRVFDGTAAAEEVIYTDGILLVVSNPTPPDMKAVEEETRQRRHFSYDGRDRVVLDHSAARNILAIDAASGRTLWTHSGPTVSVLSLAALGDRVVYHDGEAIVCLDLKTGDETWKSAPIEQRGKRLFTVSEEAPTVVLHENAVFYAWNQKLTTLSMTDGTVLWEAPWVANDYRSPVSVMLMQDLVWSMNIAAAKSPGTFTGRDILTGEIREQFDLPEFKGIGHHRCYKAKASGDYVLLSRSGVEYVNPASHSYDENHWIRGACLYGILPANGMLYSTPHACACYIKGKLNGFTAMTPGPTGPMNPDNAAGPVETGPAFHQPVEDRSRQDDWPTYRAEAGRSGRTLFPVSPDLKQTWKAEVGGSLSSLTVGNGLVFVAQKDRNTIQALDAASGSPAWTFTAGGTIDSPPTIYRGHVYFGSADGCVYNLRASDGALAWRTRAAPSDRRVVAYDRLESAWPVNGSVLIQGGTIFCAAGRSSFLDGGIRIVKLDPDSGNILASQVLYDLSAEGKEPPVTASFEMDGALSDILSGDGGSVYMRHLRFESEILKPAEPKPHLFSPTGYLDANWWHRTYWVYGDDTKAGYGGWWQAGNKLPSGRLMVFDDNAVYAFGRTFYAGMNSAQFSRGEKYVLSASEKRSGAEPDYSQANAQHRAGEYLKTDWLKIRTTPVTWSAELPFHVRAMALADKTLFAAGPYGDAVRSMESFRGQRGVRLAAASTTDGALLASYQIDALPVFDGLAAAGGRLYLALEDGSVRCFGKEGTALPSKLGEPIEILQEDLLPDDTAYRKEFQEKLGISGDQAGGKAKARNGIAKRTPITGEDASFRFAKVTGGKVVTSKLGFRLAADPDSVALALYELREPVTAKSTWSFRMQRPEGFPNPPYFQNGFFVLGDGPSDEQLIKCGVQFVQGQTRIIQGPTPGQKGEKVDLKSDPGAELPVEVTIDFETQSITLDIGGQTITAKVSRPLRQVTHVGFAAWNAVTDFSAPGVEVR